MLRTVFLSLLLISQAAPGLAQSGAAGASDGAAPAEGGLTRAGPGSMTVSGPLAGGGAVSAAQADDGVPYLPVQDLCGAAASAAVDVTRAYADCMGAETDAYDRIAAGLPGYEAGLLTSCEAATLAGEGGYITLLACLEPEGD